MESAGDTELLIQASPKPVFYDTWSNGFDYVCGHCRRMVIASCVMDGQLWDLAFRCFRCQRVSFSPVLPPEKALPRCVMLDLGPSEIDNGIDLKRIVMAGRAAVERRQLVAGVKGTTFGYVPHRPLSQELDAQLIESVIADMQQLLGPSFDSLEKSDRRGRASPTPPKNRHPLMVVVEKLRSDIASFSTPNPSVHIECLMELRALLHTLERWQKHPFWSQMVHGLYSEYLHTVITLATATFLEDTGNNVEFKETGQTRTPDLILVIGATKRVAVEIKVPTVLRTPRAALGYDRISKVVKASMKKARTGRSGQLSREQPAMLVIGGFNTWPNDRSDFQRAAQEYLRKAAESQRHGHIMAIEFLTFGAITTSNAGKQNAKAAVLMVVVTNPGYEGHIKLITETPLHLRRPLW